MSCQDHFSASSPTRFSGVSARLSWSKTTRLLKHGIDGNDVEMVEDSWTAKPGDRSSRSMMFRCPPDFGGCAAAGVTPRPTRVARARTGAKSMQRERVIGVPPIRENAGAVASEAGIGKY